MGNERGYAENLKGRLQRYISKSNRPSFTDLHDQFCIRTDAKKGKPLMSRRTIAKYLSQLIEEEKITKKRDKNSQKVLYYENPLYHMIEWANEAHYKYLKSIKTIKEAKVYCEILYRASKQKSKPRSEIIEIDTDNL